MNHSAEIAKLKDRLAKLEAQLDPPAREPELPSLGYGPARDAHGDVLPAPGAVPYEQRAAERAANEDRHAKQAWRDMTDGLPAGVFKDDCGILRRIVGGERVVGPELQEIERNLKNVSSNT